MCRVCPNLLLAIGQIALVVAAMLLLILAPPASGTMLIVPLAGHGLAAPLDVARISDARLVAQGPVAGSIVVIGDRARLVAAAWRGGMIVMAAPTWLCGDAPERV